MMRGRQDVLTRRERGRKTRKDKRKRGWLRMTM